jgi:hypothetical protein
MKKWMMAALAASTAMATPALAGTTASYTVDGSVDGVCSISASGALDFGKLTDATGAFSNTASPSSVDGNAYCNQAATTVTVTHTDLTTSGTPTTGFTNDVTYTPVLITSDRTLTGNQTNATIGAFSSLTVKAQGAAASGSAKLVAGSYSGTISITLTPAT